MLSVNDARSDLLAYRLDITEDIYQVSSITLCLDVCASVSLNIICRLAEIQTWPTDLKHLYEQHTPCTQKLLHIHTKQKPFFTISTNVLYNWSAYSEQRLHIFTINLCTYENPVSFVSWECWYTACVYVHAEVVLTLTTYISRCGHRLPCSYFLCLSFFISPFIRKQKTRGEVKKYYASWDRLSASYYVAMPKHAVFMWSRSTLKTGRFGNYGFYWETRWRIHEAHKTVM
jgi:hypothetical protein